MGDPREWVVEGSLDGKVWTKLCHWRNAPIDGKFGTPGSDDIWFVRLRQTAQNVLGAYQVGITFFDASGMACDDIGPASSLKAPVTVSDVQPSQPVRQQTSGAFDGSVAVLSER